MKTLLADFWLEALLFLEGRTVNFGEIFQGRREDAALQVIDSSDVFFPYFGEMASDVDFEKGDSFVLP